MSVHLYGLAAFAAITAISPLFIFSWPYLTLAAVPTFRWRRRSRHALGRGTMTWIVAIAGVMVALPLVTAVVSVATGRIGSETWVLAALAAVFIPFLVAAVRCHGHLVDVAGRRR